MLVCIYLRVRCYEMRAVMTRDGMGKEERRYNSRRCYRCVLACREPMQGHEIAGRHLLMRAVLCPLSASNRDRFNFLVSCAMVQHTPHHGAEKNGTTAAGR